MGLGAVPAWGDLQGWGYQVSFNGPEPLRLHRVGAGAGDPHDPHAEEPWPHLGVTRESPPPWGPCRAGGERAFGSAVHTLMTRFTFSLLFTFLISLYLSFYGSF